MKPKLKIVGAAPQDITLSMRPEIEARDWSRVHIEADKRKPLPRWFGLKR